MKETGTLDISSMLPQMMSQVGSLMGVETPSADDPTFQSLMGMLGPNVARGRVDPMLLKDHQDSEHQKPKRARRD
jgi:hypothetical protein